MRTPHRTWTNRHAQLVRQGVQQSGLDAPRTVRPLTVRDLVRLLGVAGTPSAPGVGDETTEDAVVEVVDATEGEAVEAEATIGVADSSTAEICRSISSERRMKVEALVAVTLLTVMNTSLGETSNAGHYLQLPLPSRAPLATVEVVVAAAATHSASSNSNIINNNSSTITHNSNTANSAVATGPLPSSSSSCHRSGVALVDT